MATLKFKEFITFFQMEMMCKHLDDEDIQRLLNSFMNDIDEMSESKTQCSRYHREILKSRIYCLIDKMRNGFKSENEKEIYIEEVQECIDVYTQSCYHQNTNEHLMVSNIFI